jgi:hypothetical protein
MKMDWYLSTEYNDIMSMSYGINKRVNEFYENMRERDIEVEQVQHEKEMNYFWTVKVITESEWVKNDIYPVENSEEFYNVSVDLIQLIVMIDGKILFGFTNKNELWNSNNDFENYIEIFKFKKVDL